jgi:hypothetical protein
VGDDQRAARPRRGTPGPRYRRFRFEEIFSPDAEGLRDLVRWIGLEPTDALLREARQPVNPSGGRTLPRWQEWPAAELENVYALCAELMERYGYDR